MSAIEESAAKKIKESNRILLVSPENPDIDSISCVCAFREFLKWFHPNAKTWKYCCDSLASLAENKLFQFIEGCRSVRASLPNWRPDCILIFDYGDVVRARLPEAYADIPVIGFDHHSQGGRTLDMTVVDPSAASCTIVLYRFFKYCGFVFGGTQVARTLLAGIIADTGRLSNAAANIESLKIVCDLDPDDARFSQMMRASRRRIPMRRLQVWEQLFSALRRDFDSESGLISCVVSKEIAKELHANRRDFLTFFGLMQNIEEAYAVAMIMENDYGVWNVSLRPGPSFEANAEEIAKEFGGGGHPYAAGFTFTGNIDDIDLLLSNLKNAIYLQKIKHLAV